jgi:DNA polymerase III epsilon subunit-like protein
MAGVTRGRAEAICICAVDYLTGAVLLNKLVWPAERVVSWRTDIHGITSVAMQAAVSKGQALAGWEGARQELWKLIDDSTILVGHALQHDLEVLRIIHHRVVDSAILAQNAVGPGRQWGLKTLCTQLLQKEIRENDGGVHDCLEDVLATREVALLCTQNKEGLRNWAEVAKAEEERKVLERKAAQLNKKAEKAKGKKSKAGKSKAENSNCDSGDMHSSSEFEIEIMRWSDVAEDFGWPHPDTGYDPWSD